MTQVQEELLKAHYWSSSLSKNLTSGGFHEGLDHIEYQTHLLLKHRLHQV